MKIGIISWAGTIFSIIGSFIVAFGFFKFGYIAFLIGSISWLYIAMIKKDRALALLNGTFFIANIIGLVRVFI